jgi:hypothetical protein
VSIYWQKLYGMFKMWRITNKMKKRVIILVVAGISMLVAISLFFASNLSKLADLDVFDIEDDDF